MTDTDANYPRDLTGYGRTLPHAQRPFCDLCCGLFSARQIASALTCSAHTGLQACAATLANGMPFEFPAPPPSLFRKRARGFHRAEQIRTSARSQKVQPIGLIQSASAPAR